MESYSHPPFNITIQAVRTVSRQFANTTTLLHETIARQAGLSPTDLKYLELIIQKGQMTAGELAHLTGLTTGAITGLIDRLQKKKLVKRQYAKDDRRKVFIVPITANTSRILEPLTHPQSEKILRHLQSFDEGELLTILHFFNGINEANLSAIHQISRAKGGQGATL
ncbi:MarR family winged helix-turn-helix transcriptional regulator [Paraflavitalea pollutisoli]|uniref:MarR family winged helix-turn-helix transcriptional regulator n=1 Tax=Paraflavitalea pollutisoli TaxID=3034143 RepID=UPI0023ED9A3A|nr:MarR family winged helix-turn-helix transcriptional regulator [Paraflavitalea sp. H1-2-19X]